MRNVNIKCKTNGRKAHRKEAQGDGDLTVKHDELYERLIEQAATLLTVIQDVYDIQHITPLMDEILIEQLKVNRDPRTIIEWGLELQLRMGEVTYQILDSWSRFDDTLLNSGKHHQLHLHGLQKSET